MKIIKTNGFWMFVSTVTAILALLFLGFSISHSKAQLVNECKRYPLTCEQAK